MAAPKSSRPAARARPTSKPPVATRRPPARKAAPVEGPSAPAAAPVGLVGRGADLAELRERLAVAGAVFLYGGAGVGKSRLLAELAANLDVPVGAIRAFVGDTAAAVIARAERATSSLTGGLRSALADTPRLLIIDDAHLLDDAELTQVWLAIAPGPTALGRVVIAARDRRLIGIGDIAAEQWLQPLDGDGAAALWCALGGDAAALPPAPVGGGWPWAIRRAVASADGRDAWDLGTLSTAAGRALQALAVARAPLPAHALTALGAGAVAGVTELRARHLVDVDGAGLLTIAEPARAAVLAGLAPDTARALHLGLAALLRDAAATTIDAALAQAALSTIDPLDRLREAVRHARAAGDEAQARAILVAAVPGTVQRGGRSELAAMIASLDEPLHPELVPIRIALALGGGRIADAAELVASAPSAVEALAAAEVALAQGDLARASKRLAEVAPPAASDSAPALVRALHAELALARGQRDDAQRAVRAAERPGGDEGDRARFLMARAAVEMFVGDVAAARTSLGRAAAQVGAGLTPALRAAIECQRVSCLAREGRLGEAEAVAAQAEQLARTLDDVVVADELRLARARVTLRRGDAITALAELRALVATRRARGDELGATQLEVEVAEALVARGDVVPAVELASAVHASSTRLGLAVLAARARLCLAEVAIIEARFDVAGPAVTALLAGGALDAASHARAEVLAAEIDAATTRNPATVARALAAGSGEARDDIDRGLAAALVAMASGEFQDGLERARDVAAAAERAGRRTELAMALVLTARLELARGDHGSARAAATRGVREAAKAGVVRARVHGLLALAALARDEGQPEAAVAYARDAAELASAAGLPVERLTANAALDGLAGADILADPSSPSAATMGALAIEAAARLLADLGLTAQRPFRVVDADGATSDVADASPEILRMASRSLAVDGVRESLWRRGEELVDLRRRSLLKRLLFLFAAAPGKSFSKEEIVQSVWNVDYHPLRHDAALFTNIMRIRRLLGEDGAEIIRITDDGYRFTPPRDYVFVQPR